MSEIVKNCLADKKNVLTGYLGRYAEEMEEAQAELKNAETEFKKCMEAIRIIDNFLRELES